MTDNKVHSLSQIESPTVPRFSTGISYLDDVLGGGLVKGSTVLFAGTTGAGKSTLATQLSYGIAAADNKLLYIAGEESKEQIKLRTDRLGINSNVIYLYEDTQIEEIAKTIDTLKPSVVIVDSLQMLFSKEIKNPLGSPTQMRYCLFNLCQLAKEKKVTIIFIGHSTKEGYIAGLQTLQHTVDDVLFLRLNDDQTREIYAKKNRFGSTETTHNLHMSSYGLFDHPNPQVPFGLIDNRAVTDLQIKEATTNPLVLFTLSWLTNQAKKLPEYKKTDATFTLTSSQIDAIIQKHRLTAPLIKYGIDKIKSYEIQPS